MKNAIDNNTFVDVKFNTGEWHAAKVIDKEGDIVKIRFDGMLAKYDLVCLIYYFKYNNSFTFQKLKINSIKIAPFRKFSKGYFSVIMYLNIPKGYTGFHKTWRDESDYSINELPKVLL